MPKIRSFLENLKYKKEEDRHAFAVFAASVLTVFVAFFLAMSWYLQFYDLPIHSSLLSRVVAFFQK